MSRHLEHARKMREARTLRQTVEELIGHPIDAYFLKACQPPAVPFEKACEYRMKFGVHEGLPLSEVPKEYLHWILGESEELTENIRSFLNEAQ